MKKSMFTWGHTSQHRRYSEECTMRISVKVNNGAIGAVAIAVIVGFPTASFACDGSSSYSASQCVNVFWSGNKRYIENTCNKKIEAVWCFEGGSQNNRCRDASGWKKFNNSWSLGPGRNWPISTQGRVRYNACRFTFWD